MYSALRHNTEVDRYNSVIDNGKFFIGEGRATELLEAGGIGTFHSLVKSAEGEDAISRMSAEAQVSSVL